VHRQEVYEAIQRENLRASRLEPGDTQGLGKLAGRGSLGGPQSNGQKPGDAPRR
jgi:hypothetical protein